MRTLDQSSSLQQDKATTLLSSRNYEPCFGSSSTLNFRDKNDLNKLCKFTDDMKWTLLYRASVDGFSAKDFHKKCDKREKTLTIIKTNEGK